MLLRIRYSTQCEACMYSIVVSRDGMDRAFLLEQSHDEKVKKAMAKIGRRCAINVFKYFLPGLDLSSLYNRANYEYDPRDYGYTWVGANYDPRMVYDGTAYDRTAPVRLSVVITELNDPSLILQLSGGPPTHPASHSRRSLRRRTIVSSSSS